MDMTVAGGAVAGAASSIHRCVVGVNAAWELRSDFTVIRHVVARRFECDETSECDIAIPHARINDALDRQQDI